MLVYVVRGLCVCVRVYFMCRFACLVGLFLCLFVGLFSVVGGLFDCSLLCACLLVCVCCVFACLCVLCFFVCSCVCLVVLGFL